MWTVTVRGPASGLVPLCTDCGNVCDVTWTALATGETLGSDCSGTLEVMELIPKAIDAEKCWM
jgi:hypothetical protein